MRNKILSLIISITLVLGALVSLSSCDALKNILGSTTESEGEGDLGGVESGDKGNSSGGTSVGGSSTSGSGDSTGTGDSDGDVSGDSNSDSNGDSKTEYIPGVSDEAADADNLTSAQRALLSTVIVRPNFDVYNGYTYRTETINGSGVIYALDRAAGDAIIVTNYHVIYYKNATNPISEDINIYLYGMEAEQYKVKATFVGGSLTEDIAVLRVSGSDVIKNSCAVSVKIGDSAALSVTDRVLAVGNPEGDGISISDGIVSMNDETISMTASDGRTIIDLRVIRIDCGINQGNSGGGLYDMDGKLVGIVNAKKTGGEIDNIGWALPINRVKNLVENILDHCDGATATNPKKALLGVTLYAAAMGVHVDSASGDVTRYEVVEIYEVTNTCIIKDKIQVGDRILYTTVDGVKVNSDRVHMVVDHLLVARVGSTVVLGVERDGESFEITITLTEENFVTMN